MKPFTFRKNKMMTGKKAKEFLAIAVPRPELNNPVIREPVYALPDGRIVVAIVVNEPRQPNQNSADFPVVLPMGLYANEEKMMELVEEILEDMEANGELPEPYPSYQDCGDILSGEEVAAFRTTHQDLGEGTYDYTPNFTAHYFKDAAGKVLMVHFHDEDDELVGDKGKPQGPQMTIRTIYASEENARQWQAYLRSTLPQSPIRHPQPQGGVQMVFEELTGTAAQNFLQTHQDLGPGAYKVLAPGGIHFFKSPDGKILLAQSIADGSRLRPEPKSAGPYIVLHRIYDSEEAIRAWEAHDVEWHQRNQKPQEHLLWPYTRNEPEWPQHLEAWRKFLSENLAIPPEALDYSLKSCKLLDRQRKAHKIGQRIFRKEYFAPFLAYLHEVVRRHWNGQWVMRPSDWAADVYEPYILRPDGSELRLFIEYWEAAEENYRTFSLHSLATLATREDLLDMLL